MQFNNQLNKTENKNMTTPHLRKSIGFLLIPLVLACFGFSHTAQAQLPSPAPDGGYPNDNTAEGDGALFSVTSGNNNTGLGFHAAYSNTSSQNNTAVGAFALENNTTGSANTAIG